MWITYSPSIIPLFSPSTAIPLLLVRLALQYTRPFGVILNKSAATPPTGALLPSITWTDNLPTG